MTSPFARPRAVLLAVLVGVLGVLASGCGTPTGQAEALRPRDGRAGIQLSGTVDGRQVAVADGLPRLVVDDCDPRRGDEDVCVVTQTLDGRLVVLALENPAALQEGVTLSVGDPPCGDEQACDEVTDVALVDVQLDTGGRVRAVDGSLDVRVVEPFRRYSARVTLTLPDGRLSGEIDVVPRPR